MSKYIHSRQVQEPCNVFYHLLGFVCASFYIFIKVKRRQKVWFYNYWPSVHPHKKTSRLHINITAVEILTLNMLQSGAYNSNWNFIIVIFFPEVN